jgi:putative addiction module component (TIGR02574 family)
MTDDWPQSRTDRLRLMGETGDDIDPEDVPVTDAQWAEIERRMAEYEADPTLGVPWEVVRERLAQRPRGS